MDQVGAAKAGAGILTYSNVLVTGNIVLEGIGSDSDIGQSIGVVLERVHAHRYIRASGGGAV